MLGLVRGSPRSKEWVGLFRPSFEAVRAILHPEPLRTKRPRLAEFELGERKEQILNLSPNLNPNPAKKVGGEQIPGKELLCASVRVETE